MDEKQLLQIKKVIDIFLRRKKLIIVCFFAAVIGGIGIYLKTPKSYQATAVIIFQRQSINPTAMSPDVQTRARDMVNTLSEQVKSRSSLEEIIKQFDLYTQARERFPMEDVVNSMDRHIQIDSDRGDTFRVNFSGNDPKKVMLVTNALAAKFIEENIRYREQRVTETSIYIKDELAMAKKVLDEKELLMRDFKLKYYNEMPQRLTVNMARLNSLQTQYQTNQDTIQELERTRILVQEQIGARSRELQQRDFGGSDVGVPREIVQDEFSRLRQELLALRARYTDEHPDVKRLQKRLASLEEGKKTNVSKNIDGEFGERRTEQAAQESISTSQDFANIDSQLEQLKLQRNDIEFNLSNLKEEREEIRQQIEMYKKWIEAAPTREAEWSALTRDYNQLNERYQALVSQKLAAESAESLERKQKGSQFRIVDSAHFPEKPFKPDFRKIMLMAVVLGLGLGGGISFALEFLDRSFKEAADIDAYLGVPVVCAIPYVESEIEKKKNRIKAFLGWIGCFATFLAITAAVFYLIHKGHIII